MQDQRDQGLFCEFNSALIFLYFTAGVVDTLASVRFSICDRQAGSASEAECSFLQCCKDQESSENCIENGDLPWPWPASQPAAHSPSQATR